MITQKYVIVIRLDFFASLNGIFLYKKMYFEKIAFFYYIHHQLIYFPNANQNKIFNWIKVNY